MDYLRKRLPMAIVVAVTLSLTGLAALAQGGGQVTPAAVSNINANKVDGRDAVKATQSLNKRKGKLMSFNSAGYLPTNIVDGNVATLTSLGSTTGAVNEVDNPVNWNQIQNVPPAVLAADTTRSFIAQESPAIAPAGIGLVFVDHAIGTEVETTLIPTAVGAAFSTFPWAAPAFGEEFDQRLTATTLRHAVLVKNVSGVASTVKLRVTVWNDSYVSVAAAKRGVKVTFVENPRKALKALR